MYLHFSTVGLALALVLGLAISDAQAQLTVTAYDHINYEGVSKRLTVSRCENILDFNDRASSIRTSGCVILYEDGCCQGSILQIEGDTASLLPTFNDKLTSMSPCGNYRPPIPETIRETWLGHSQTMKKVAEDGDIAIYYNDQVKMNASALQTQQDYLKRLWTYVRRTYGEFGPEEGRLSAYMHANVNGVSSRQNYFDLPSSCHNLVDLVGGANGWSTELTGGELDILTHEVSHIVEYASKRVHGSPSYRLWGDSKWAEIFIYDAYHALGMTQERDRFRGTVENGSDNFPRPNTYWFRDWFFPIYQKYRGASLLNNYFHLVGAYFPRHSNKWQYVFGRNMNLGEFVHFFSGAAGTDLKCHARIAFGWDDTAESELQKAKVDFPYVFY